LCSTAVASAAVDILITHRLPAGPHISRRP
jgi:hypothetical protein